mmetsp:Transcript_24467/g.37695  ORF Transcript_24467/g.37695 Transcript_24467/m.37695 type:complete len:336 (+) Transcript_24467:14-1021(+)
MKIRCLPSNLGVVVVCLLSIVVYLSNFTQAAVVVVDADTPSEPTLPLQNRKVPLKTSSRLSFPFLFRSKEGSALFNKETKLEKTTFDNNLAILEGDGDFTKVSSTQQNMSESSSSFTALPWWVSLAGQLAPWAAFIVFLAPIPTLRQVARDKNIGSLPLLPYSSMIANGFVWLVYGVLKHEAKIYVVNGVGCVLGCAYYYGYTHSNCPPKTASTHFRGIMSVILGTVSLACTLPTDTAASLIGTSGVVFCIALFASPLSALKTVIETKSAKSIPLPFTIACIINCGSWSILGLMDMKDVNIYLPNLLGLACGLVQVALKLMYSGRAVGNEGKLPM